MKPLRGPWMAVGEVLGSPTPPQVQRTTTDGPAANGDGPTRKAGFNFGRHRWLGRVVRDEKLPGAAVRTAVLLWELQNAERGYAWPSLTHIAMTLKMHKATVVRSLRTLKRRGWIAVRHRGGRLRTNEYRVAFGSMDEGDEGIGSVQQSQPDNETVAPRQRNGRNQTPQ